MPVDQLAENSVCESRWAREKEAKLESSDGTTREAGKQSEHHSRVRSRPSTRSVRQPPRGQKMLIRGET